MSQGKKKVSVTIYGESYVVLGDADSRQIERLAAVVDKKMRLISQRNPRLTTSKVAVLTALNLAEELTRLKEEQQALVKLLEEEKE